MEAKQYIPFEATHPVFVLKEELQARGIKQKEFALDIDMQPTMLNELINEKRSVTAEIALSLEKALGIPADFWMRFQAGYELDCARIKERNIHKNQQIEIWSLIKQFVPVSIFEKRGVLTNSLNENISLIWEIFEVKSVAELEASIASNRKLAFYKKSEKLTNDQLNIFAWSKLAHWSAKKESPEQFQPQNKEKIIAELKALYHVKSDVIAGTKKILNENGIKFLIIEKFKQSPIDGYSFWSLNNPAMVLTLRKKNFDNFAFSVMHELGHIFEHLQPNHDEDFLNIEYPEAEQNEKEKEANRFANQCFIDNGVWQDFLKQNPRFNYQTTEKNINCLAESLGLHPSIVFGRYCYETSQFNIKTSMDR
ncbi:MAG: HigA family addiction module antitoxin [Draconibacterium sp.]|nr:HigA family addiction module antitoxin [Draconibacterium sp.]